MVVVDGSHSPASARIVAESARFQNLNVSLADARTARSRLESGSADLEVEIPPGLGTVDASDHLHAAEVVLTYRSGGQGEQAASLVGAAVDRADRELQNAPQVVTVRSHLLNASLGLLSLFLPGVLVFNVINAGLILAAGIFAGYRTSGTLRRIQATGVSPADLVLAHAASNLVLATAQVLLMLIAADLIFATLVPIPALLAVTMLGYLVFLGIGLAISGWVRDPQRAPVIATSIAFPLIFIGLFPPSAFGGNAGQVLGLLPVSMATHALRAIVAGSGLGSFAGDLGGLGAWAAVSLIAAGRVFRWDP